MKAVAKVACDDVLHLRPLAVLARVCMLFSNTDFTVSRLRPGPRQPSVGADPKQVLAMLMQCFANREEVEIAGDGDLAELGVLALKNVLEHMTALEAVDTRRTGEPALHRLVFELIEGELSLRLHAGDDGDAKEATKRLLRQAKTILLHAQVTPTRLPRTTHETSAMLADHFHETTARVFPLIAKHFGSALVLSFPSAGGPAPEDHDLSLSDDSWSRYGLIASAPAPGTRVTIRTSGPQAHECAECVAGMVRFLPIVDDRMRNEGIGADASPRKIAVFVDFIKQFADRSNPRKGVLPLRQPVLHDILAESCITIVEEQTDKDSVLRELAELHERHSGVPAQKTLEQTYLRARESSTFEQGVAIPHARMDTGPLVAFYLGLYSRGVPWVEDKRAYVVLLVVAAADAPEKYLAYLGQACRVLLDEDALEGLLRSRSRTEAWAAIHLAEVRMGAPLPSVQERRVLVVESVADAQTLRRDRAINETPRMAGVNVQYVYACTERDGHIHFDPHLFEQTLKLRIAKACPDFVLLHVGMAFIKYGSDLMRVFKRLRKQFPRVRFGYQSSASRPVDPDAFDHDRETTRFQKEFFAIAHEG